MSSSDPQHALLLRWLARGTGVLSTVVLLRTLTGLTGLFGGDGWAMVRPLQWIGFLFFPVGVIVGLLLAWRREAIGAAVAVACLTASYLCQGVLFGRLPSSPRSLILTAPAVLFFASWYANRRRDNAVPDGADSAVRYVQNGLMVVGATALGASTLGLGAACFLAVGPFPHGGRNDLGGLALALILFGGSAALGAIIGCFVGVRWSIKHDGGLWKPRVWIGVTLGIVLGLLLQFTSILGDLLAYWPVVAVLTAGLGMLGGAIASFAGSSWNRDDGEQPQDQ